MGSASVSTFALSGAVSAPNLQARAALGSPAGPDRAGDLEEPTGARLASYPPPYVSLQLWPLSTLTGHTPSVTGQHHLTAPCIRCGFGLEARPSLVLSGDDARSATGATELALLLGQSETTHSGR